MSKFNLQKYKESIKVADVQLKKDSYIPVNPALQAVMGLPGLPLGHIFQVYGPSNGGKSSFGFHVAAKAQTVDVLPIFITTESKVSWERADAFGVKLDECILEYATYLEDIFKIIDRHLAAQAKGDLPVDIMFIVDSIGNTISSASLTTNKDGTVELGGAMMKAAKSLRENLRVFSHRINDTRRITSPKTAGLIFINHSYKQPPAFPGGPTTEVPYGGDAIYYSSSLVIKVKKTKQLKTVKNGMDITFGLVSKLSIEKNHINGVSNSGEFVIVPSDIIANEKGAIEDYKDAHKAQWGNVEFNEED